MSAPLRRELGPWAAVLITVGAMLGSGVFATPHDVAGLIRSPVLTLALWLGGGVLSLLGALSFAELGAAIPETGGMYVYLHRAFGPFAAFAFGWAMTVVLVPSSIGYFSLITAQHVTALLHLARGTVRPISIALVFVLVGVNLIGVRAGAGVQSAVTMLKYAGVLGLAALGLLAFHGPARVEEPIAATTHVPWLTAMAALVPVLWAYDGWIDVTSVAGEVREPAKNVPRSLILGTLLVTALYALVNIAYLRGLGTSFLARTETPAVDAAAIAFGEPGRIGVSVLVALSTFGGCAVALLTGSRIVFAVASDGWFVRAFAHTSKRGVPDVALAACGLLAMAYLTQRGGALAETFVIGAWPFYAIASFATIRLRRTEPNLPRPHRTVGYPYPIIAFALVSMGVVASYGFTRPRQTLFSLGLIALAAPVYFAVSRWRASHTSV